LVNTEGASIALEILGVVRGRCRISGGLIEKGTRRTGPPGLILGLRKSGGKDERARIGKKFLGDLGVVRGKKQNTDKWQVKSPRPN